jgi:hypothetical protein
VPESEQGVLMLACVPCRRVVTVAYTAASVAQGVTNLDDYRTCTYCGKRMVETESADCGHVELPGEPCPCHS